MTRVATGRVLAITSNFPRWLGDSTTPFVLNLAADLRDHGWEVDVLAPHDEGAERAERLGGVDVRRFRYAWPESSQTLCYRGGALLNLRASKSNLLKAPGLVAAELASAARALKRERYDLVHSHWLLPQGFVGGVLRRTMGVPHVTTIHGGDVFALNSGFLKAFKRFAVRNSDAVTVNSSATMAALEELGAEPAVVRRIPMGVSIELASTEQMADVRARFRGNGPRIVFVGRLVEEKGVGDLLEAVATVRKQLPQVSAMIVGDGPHRSRFEDHALRLGVDDVVEFTGWVQPSDIPSYMAAADIFAGPSRSSRDGWTEAYGLSFAEALAAGTPVVATSAGGIGDIVEHEVNGLVVDEGAPDQLAAAVKSLAEDPARMASFGEAGRLKAVGKLSRDASAQAFAELFQTLVESRSQRR